MRQDKVCADSRPPAVAVLDTIKATTTSYSWLRRTPIGALPPSLARRLEKKRAAVGLQWHAKHPASSLSLGKIASKYADISFFNFKLYRYF
ncbi:hypothetical protein ACFS07_09275 [Undibacterium arcticum]